MERPGAFNACLSIWIRWKKNKDMGLKRYTADNQIGRLNFLLPLDSPPKPREPALHLRYNVGCKRWPPVLSGLLSISSDGVLGTALIIGEPEWRSFLQMTNLCKSLSMMLLFMVDFGDLCSGDNEELLWLLWKAFPICKLTMSNKDCRRCLPPILSFYDSISSMVKIFNVKHKHKNVRQYFFVPLLFYIKYLNIHIEHLQVKTKSENYFHIMRYCYGISRISKKVFST